MWRSLSIVPALVLVGLAGLAGCVSSQLWPDPQPNTYLAGIYHDRAGRLMAVECDLDAYGHATQICAPETVDDPAAPPAPIMPDGPALPEARRAPRPAPDTAALAHAIDASGTRRLLRLCRTTFSPQTTSIEFAISIAPTGDITSLDLREAAGPFADCTTRALRTATIAPFDGAPAHLEQQLAL